MLFRGLRRLKKILVAGAGHGGLVAAYHLARAGHDVTVIEQKARDALGYDWCDTMCRSDFAEADIPKPPEAVFHGNYRVYFQNPSGTVRIPSSRAENPNVVYIDRQYLIRYLISLAEESGVHFRFETPVRSAVTGGEAVTGLMLQNGESIFADLVIDSAGMHSPVRRSLPASFGIIRDIPQRNVFCVFRAYYEKTEDRSSDPPHGVFFYHCGLRGMDWAICEKTHIDILVGGFGQLTQKDVDTAVADFRRQLPFMGEKIVRGGITETIPLWKMLPVTVCTGYAVLGNAASMTEPLSGSGIDLCMRSGKMLADTVTESEDCSVQSLWKYNYKFYKTYACHYLPEDIVRDYLLKVSAEDVDYFFEKEILSSKELGDGVGAEYTPKDILMKGVHILQRPHLLLPLAQSLRSAVKIGRVNRTIPEKYEKTAVERWAKLYESL